MGEVAKIKKFLAEARYHHQEATSVDMVNVMKQYKGLVSNLEPYVFNDGTCRKLTNLSGTIPVRYKGNTYNIPVRLWLMDTHPYNSPICYVAPTADMCIKVSKFVDHNGKVYLPYLHEWDASKANLLGLVQVMITVFGEQPPVYTKSKAPYPTQQAMPTASPPYPVYPGAATPYPAMPSQAMPQPGGFPPYPSMASETPYPPAYPPASSGYPPPQQTPYPPMQPSPMASGYPPQAGVGAGGGTITEEHIRASLLSAVEDKLRRRLREQFSQGTAELETLRRTNLELVQGKSKLEGLVGRLDKDCAELDKAIATLEEKEAELEKGLGKLSSEEPIDIDEAVTTTAPLYRQLLNAFAEESAIEDVIYYLGEALRRGRIDLDAFLKQVRALSRKQFMLRALMNRCRQKAGLAG
ncbi:tumor susceptibility gene 101 protein [Neocloeon triangulifer]|uniref:tumor susceptibility gene 101 protein n=1 Tax=Neocloeon triangulifer TaxID=2078957 RepID=UPI00286F75CB|nr:tumor susceptibility gene 101 protein [Neocloeon triangulifer]